jgi:ArsR family transcriptional regulator, arsenate/arsenite/antimonite-responsive transcriptional repressor
MGISNKENFSEFQNKLSDFAKILSSPARIAILELIASKQNCICGDIVQELGLSQSTVSQHLKELKIIGLIQGTIKGPKICYCLHKETWNKMNRLFKEFLNKKNIKTIRNC